MVWSRIKKLLDKENQQQVEDKPVVEKRTLEEVTINPPAYVYYDLPSFLAKVAAVYDLPEEHKEAYDQVISLAQQFSDVGLTPIIVYDKNNHLMFTTSQEKLTGELN